MAARVRKTLPSGMDLDTGNPGGLPHREHRSKKGRRTGYRNWRDNKIFMKEKLDRILKKDTD